MSKLGARRVNCGGKYRPGQGAEGVMSHNPGAGADIQSVLCDLWIKLWTIALVRYLDIQIVDSQMGWEGSSVILGSQWSGSVVMDGSVMVGG